MMRNIKLQVGSLLKSIGMTQKELSHKTGIRESTISVICRGTQTCVNYEHLSKIAEALDVKDISKLLNFE